MSLSWKSLVWTIEAIHFTIFGWRVAPLMPFTFTQYDYCETWVSRVCAFVRITLFLINIHSTRYKPHGKNDTYTDCIHKVPLRVAKGLTPFDNHYYSHRTHIFSIAFGVVLPNKPKDTYTHTFTHAFSTQLNCSWHNAYERRGDEEGRGGK